MLILERFCYSDMGTFGKLKFNDREWYTVEKPWLDNENKISCIPTGYYTAERYKSPTPNRGIIWMLNRVPKRSFIQIHAGNTMDDVIGCIAVGKELGCLEGKWAVLDSKAALIELMHETREFKEIAIQVTNNCIEGMK